MWSVIIFLNWKVLKGFDRLCLKTVIMFGRCVVQYILINVKTLTNETIHQSSIFYFMSYHNLRWGRTQFKLLETKKQRDKEREREREQETKKERERARDGEKERKRKKDGEKATNGKIQFPAQVPAHSIQLFVTQPNIIRHSSSQLHVHRALSLCARVHGPWAIACLANCCVCVGLCGSVGGSLCSFVGVWVWVLVVVCGCLCVSVGVAVCQIVSCFPVF